MKIVIINGSPRKKGATAKILKILEEHLKSNEGVEVSYKCLTNYNLMDCTGCISCYNKGICYLDDDLENINKDVANADALIIGSPVYVSNVPGVLKRYIDRGHFVLEQSLHNKYTFAVTTYEIGGSKDVVNILNKLFKIAGGILLGNLQIKLPFNADPYTMPLLENKIKKTANNIYKAIKNKKRKSFADNIFNRIAVYNIIKPYIIQKPKQYKAVLERWGKLKIIK